MKVGIIGYGWIGKATQKLFPNAQVYDKYIEGTIRDAVYGDDPRQNLWFSFVFPKNRGADSKCIPKDIYGWCAWAESVGIDPTATKSLLEYNNTLIKRNN